MRILFQTHVMYTRDNYMACGPLPPSSSKCLVNPDSGKSANFFSIKDVHVLRNILPDPHPLAVSLPDGTVKWSTHIATLNIPCLPAAARDVHIIDGFVGSLLSIATLCDNVLSVTYDNKCVQVRDNESVLISGQRDYSTGLWCIDLLSAANIPTRLLDTATINTDTTRHFDNNNASAAFPNSVSTASSVVSFYHSCMSSPTLPTFTHAVSAGWIRLQLQ